MRFGTRLLIGALAAVFLSFGVLFFAAQRLLRDHLEQAFASQLEHEARVITATTISDVQTFIPVVRRYGTFLGRRVSVIDQSGVIIADSEFDEQSVTLLGNQREQPEVRAALGGRTGVDKHVNTATGRTELHVAIPAARGVIRVSASLEPVDQTMRRVNLAILASGALAVVLVSLLALVAGRQLTRPLTALARAGRTAPGRAAIDYPVSDIAEIRELIRSFRSTHDELIGRVTTLNQERGETYRIIESMVEGVIATDVRGNIVICNRAARELLGYDHDDTLPNIRELFHQSDARDLVTSVLAGEGDPGREIELNDRSTLITARPLPTGGIVLGMLDVTDLKRLQTMRRDFVGNVSHELKTPLTNILGYAETLMTDDVDAETRRQFLETIQRHGVRMRNLVDDLLDLARLEAGGWEPTRRPISVIEVITGVWNNFSQRANDSSITFACDAAPSLRVDADRDALEQILTNLFDNAVRHSPPGSRISVRAAKINGKVEIAVSDTGTGISSEHVPRVFERFYRVDAGRSRAAGGTGLGLAIVKHLIEAHGGAVELASTLGKGTTVTLRFPTPESH